MNEDTPSLLGLPLNRVIAFAGPYIATASGVIATWLITHIHILATFHVGNNDLAQAIAQGLVFLVVTGVTWLGHQKWLDGYQAWAYGKDAGGAGATAQNLDGPLAAPADTGEFGPGAAADPFGPAEGDPTVPPGLQG